MLKNLIDKALTLFCWIGGLFLFLGILQLFCFTTFKIPTDSMEPELIAGDYIVVNKLVYGARLFNVFDAIEKRDVEIHRTWGVGEIKRNDVVVFNYPYPSKKGGITFDVMKYYVKRCVALPGDTFEIANAHYKVKGVGTLLGNRKGQDELAALLASGKDDCEQRVAMKGYPHDSLIGWNIAEFGPLYIPKVGDVICLNRLNWALYRELIEWEQQKSLLWKEGECWLGEDRITTYQFTHNYYFMAGDKAVNSRDSRYWGMLPEEFIVGKAVFIWKSKDVLSGDIRWDRILKRIE